MNQSPSLVAIRPAEPADADAIAQLMQAEPGFWQPSWSPELIARTLAASTTIAFVTLAAAEPMTVPLLASPAVHTQSTLPIAGFACAHNLGFRGYLSELIVAPSCRGQGHARALLAAIEQRLADQGAPRHHRSLTRRGSVLPKKGSTTLPRKCRPQEATINSSGTRPPTKPHPVVTYIKIKTRHRHQDHLVQ